MKHKYSKNIVYQIFIQSMVMMLTALGSLMFMTWIIRDTAQVNDIYISAAYQAAGTFVIMTIVLVSSNTYLYRKRLKEIDTLSSAIESVANGDYTAKINIDPKDPMAKVYEDFNKMTDELSSVKILRNDFINGYSHEFKTPVASINGFAELLLEKELPDDEKLQYLQIIRDESARLSKLTSDTLVLSRLSVQQIVTDTEDYDLGEQLRQCSILLSKSWLDKHIEFSGEFSSVSYHGNKEMLQQLWINLIGNAVKYTPENGEIAVSVSSDDKNAVVVISDTGEGMTEETLSHLFEPYYQGDSSRSVQGLGLGLAIAHRIVELCRGEIKVKSEYGAGTDFTVVLPLK